MITLVPVIWLLVIAAVAFLRLRALVHPQQIESSTGDLIKLKGVTDEIGFYPTLILILGLMIFTALIAVELGRRMGNPNDRHLKEQRANLARARSALEAVNAEQREAAGLKTAVDLYLNGASETHERYRKEIASGFDEVEIAYVQSFLMEMDDPDALHYAVTILDYHQNQRHH